MQKWSPGIIIPAVIIAGCFILIWSGRDSEIKTIFASACGWIFHTAFTSKNDVEEVKK